MLRIALLIALAAAFGCDRKQADETTPKTAAATTSTALETSGEAASDDPDPTAAPEEVLTVTGEFGRKGKLPTREGDPKVVEVPDTVAEQLNDEAAERMTAIALRRGFEDLRIELGGEGADGMRLVVRRGDDQVEVHVPPARHPAEAITNLDHTFERALTNLGGTVEGPE